MNDTAVNEEVESREERIARASHEVDLLHLDSGPASWEPVPSATLRALAEKKLAGEDLIAPPSVFGVGPTYLLYRGRAHMFFGDTSSCKSWIALVAVVQEMQLGHDALVLDLEDGPELAVERLVQLGATPEQIGQHLIYANPDSPFTRDAEIGLMLDLMDRSPTIGVVDSMTELLSVHEANPNAQLDVARVHRTVIRWLTQHGAAVVLIDHTGKTPSVAGPAGSERKVSGIDGASFKFTQKEPFGRGVTGKTEIKLGSKDRGGHLRRYADKGVIAVVKLISDPETEAVTVEFSRGGAAGSVAEASARLEDQRHTVLRLVGEQPGIKKTDLRDGCGFIATDLDAVVLQLMHDDKIKMRRFGKTQRHYLPQDVPTEE